MGIKADSYMGRTVAKGRPKGGSEGGKRGQWLDEKGRARNVGERGDKRQEVLTEMQEALEWEREECLEEELQDNGKEQGQEERSRKRHRQDSMENEQPAKRLARDEMLHFPTGTVHFGKGGLDKGRGAKGQKETTSARQDQNPKGKGMKDEMETGKWKAGMGEDEVAARVAWTKKQEQARELRRTTAQTNHSTAEKIARMEKGALELAWQREMMEEREKKANLELIAGKARLEKVIEERTRWARWEAEEGKASEGYTKGVDKSKSSARMGAKSFPPPPKEGQERMAVRERERMEVEKRRREEEERAEKVRIGKQETREHKKCFYAHTKPQTDSDTAKGKLSTKSPTTMEDPGKGPPPKGTHKGPQHGKGNAGKNERKEKVSKDTEDPHQEAKDRAKYKEMIEQYKQMGLAPPTYATFKATMDNKRERVEARLRSMPVTKNAEAEKNGMDTQTKLGNKGKGGKVSKDDGNRDTLGGGKTGKGGKKGTGEKDTQKESCKGKESAPKMTAKVTAETQAPIKTKEHLEKVKEGNKTGAPKKPEAKAKAKVQAIIKKITENKSPTGPQKVLGKKGQKTSEPQGTQMEKTPPTKGSKGSPRLGTHWRRGRVSATRRQLPLGCPSMRGK